VKSFIPGSPATNRFRSNTKDASFNQMDAKKTKKILAA